MNLWNKIWKVIFALVLVTVFLIFIIFPSLPGSYGSFWLLRATDPVFTFGSIGIVLFLAWVGELPIYFLNLKRSGLFRPFSQWLHFSAPAIFLLSLVFYFFYIFYEFSYAYYFAVMTFGPFVIFFSTAFSIAYVGMASIKLAFLQAFLLLWELLFYSVFYPDP